MEVTVKQNSKIPFCHMKTYSKQSLPPGTYPAKTVEMNENGNMVTWLVLDVEDNQYGLDEFDIPHWLKKDGRGNYSTAY